MEKNVIKVENYLHDEERELVVLVKHWNVSEKLDLNFQDYEQLKYPEIEDNEVVAPDIQAELAEGLICTTKKYIVETHSDYIINRLVRRIVEDGLEGEAKNIIEKIRFYLVKKNDNNEIVFNEVKTDFVFGIPLWPEGFSDRCFKEQSATVKASIEKKKKMAEAEQNSDK